MSSTPAATNRALDAAVQEVEATYVAANPKSHAAWQQALKAMPGGNTRTVLHFDPFPATMARGAGAYLEDIDGHRYVDFLGEYSAGLYGHSNDAIRAAVHAALDDGIVLGGPNTYEVKLAELVKERFPSVEQLRFCNSGTEANIMALSLARVHTGREAVLVFDAGYHGGVLTFAYGGSPLNLPFPYVVAPYNEIDRTLALIEQNAQRLAAVIVEPMMGGGGCIPATRAFLQALRQATEKHGIVLVFDEVMTSRLSYGGLQGKHGIRPDMTSFGKYIGGGLTFGAFGGRAEILAPLDPRKPGALSHSGTYNNNVLTMAAGYAGLSKVLTREAVEGLNSRGEALQKRLAETAARAGVPLQVTGVGSLFCLHFQSQPIVKPADSVSDPQARKLVQLGLINRGVYMARRGYVAMSLEIGDQEMRAFCDALEDLLSEHRGALIAADQKAAAE
jgi:glutamate-1-semialdehyde 2,1-aminomutase